MHHVMDIHIYIYIYTVPPLGSTILWLAEALHTKSVDPAFCWANSTPRILGTGPGLGTNPYNRHKLYRTGLRDPRFQDLDPGARSVTTCTGLYRAGLRHPTWIPPVQLAPVVSVCTVAKARIQDPMPDMSLALKEPKYERTCFSLFITWRLYPVGHLTLPPRHQEGFLEAPGI